MGITGRQLLYGDLWLIGCCVFYLAWWFLAFKPTNPIHGFRAGWLLIPAAIAGILCVVTVIRAGSQAHTAQQVFSTRALILAGVVAYVVLLLITLLVFRRPVTSELFLIVGWAVLALYEANTLFGVQLFTRPQTVGFIVVILAVLVICMVCYTIYYRLDALPRYIVGAIPLTLGAIVMAVMSFSISHSR